MGHYAAEMDGSKQPYDSHRDHLQSSTPTFVEDKVDHHTDTGVDFGFSFHDEKEIKTLSPVDRKSLTSEQYEDKLSGLVAMVDKLFDSLIGDPGKDYIYWPKRRNQINEWRQKINQYLEDK